MTSVVKDVCKLEKRYGSIMNVPENNTDLIRIRLFLAEDQHGRPKKTMRLHFDLDKAQRLYDTGMKISKMASILNVKQNLIQNGILKNMLKTDKRKLALKQAKAHKRNQKYNLYKGHLFVAAGTINELSNRINVTPAAIQYYTTRYSKDGYNVERVP